MSGHRSRLGIVLLIVLVAGYFVYVAVSPPGGEETVDETKRPRPQPAPPATPLEQLRSAWDSKAQADWPVGELLASMSEKAYFSPVNAQASFHTLGFERVMTVAAGSLIGYVVSGEDVTVVVFRGTDDPSDWLVNLDCISIDTPHGAIHKGFYKAYQPLKPQIVTLLQERHPRHLWITGHSLGGALALVCAYDLIENEKLDLDGVVTFGQPMVARKQLADHLDTVLVGRYAHFVNEKDIVPRLPPTYSHCGSLVWFTEGRIKRSKPKRLVYGHVGPKDSPTAKGDALVPLSQEQFEQLKARMRKEAKEPHRLPDGTPLVEGNIPGVRDHSIQLYLDKIRSFLRSIGAR